MAATEKIQEITQLSNEDISSKGAIILSDLRGHLKYESALLGLHEKKEFVFQQLGPEEYPDPIREAGEEAIADAQEEAGITSDLTFQPSATETIHKTRRFKGPKIEVTKKGGRPPKRKKKK